MTTLTRIVAAARQRVGTAQAHPAARWLSPVLGLAMLGALALQVGEIGWGTVARVWPTSPLFYLVFLLMYLGPIAGELAIYRRLWGVGVADAPMFLRKRVMNEALMGYSGEAYAVWWASRRPAGRFSAMAAVKDVNLVSGVIGNAAAIALLAATLLFADGARLAEAAAAVSGRAILITLAIMGAVILFLVAKPSLFSLPRRELAFIAGVHTLRVIAGVLFIVLLWDIALPGVALGLWLALAAWRNLFGRLPFLPNKELLFANLAIVALGRDGREVAALLALTAAMTLVAHLVTMLACAAPRRAAAPALTA